MRRLPVFALVALAISAPAHGAVPGSNGDVLAVGTEGETSTLYAFDPGGAGPTPLAGPFPWDALTQFSRVSPDGAKATTNDGSAIRVLDLASGELGDPVAPAACPGEWSATGDRIAFMSRAGDITRLQIVDADGGVPVTVLELDTDGENDVTNTAACPVWTPDGEELVFVRSAARCSGGGCPTHLLADWLQAVGTDGTGLRDLTTPDFVADEDENGPIDRDVMFGPDVAPDGSSVVFSAGRTQTDQTSIEEVPIAGGTPVTLTGGSAAVLGYFLVNPAYSPDGTRIVYSTAVFFGSGLRTLDSDGTDDAPFADATTDGPAARDIQPQWMPATLPVLIASGPPELTRSTAAAFEFAAPDPPAGHYECRLDGAAFSECESPQSYTGLAEGTHTFAVRFVPDEGPPGTPASRTWTVDTTAPTAVVDSAPSGEGNGPDATIAFHADDGSGFTCALDDGAEAPCTSPLQLTGLAAGAHELRIRATDAAGNQQADPTVVRWSVRSDRVDVVAECPANTVNRVAFGPIVAVAPTVAGCFAMEAVDGRQVRVARGPIFVNGIKLTPQPGARLAVDGALGNGTVRSIGGEARWEFGALDFTSEVHIDSLAATSGGRVVSRLVGVMSSAFALPVSGVPTLEFTADNGGQATLKLALELPDFFTALPASDGSEAPESKLTAEFSGTASNDLGVFFAGKASISDLWLRGKVKLKNLTLGVDQAKETLEGSVGLALAKGAVKPPGIGEDGVLTASVSLGPGGLIGPLRSFTLEASNIGVHLGYGFFLQRGGGGVEAAGDAVKWAFTGGASWGPKIKLEVAGVELFDGEAVSLDGSYTLTVPGGPGPVVVGAAGTGKVIDIQFVNGTVNYSNPGGIAMTGSYDHSVAGYGFLANVDRAWFDPATDDFSIEASGESRLPGPADLLFNDRANVVISKTGFAACIGDPGEAFGFTRIWGRDPDLFADGCDVGPFRRGPATAAQAGAARTVDVPRNAPVTVVEVSGAGPAPKLAIRGPAGSPALQMPADGLLDRDGVLALEDPRRAVTTLVLTRPAAGTWTLTPLAGSAIASVDVADGLPPLRVRARVRGRGTRRTLTWRARGLKGHRLSLVERGRGGSADRLVETTRSRGRKRFAPSPFVVGTRRRIEAVVTRGGIARRTLTVARFTGSAPNVGKARGIKRRAKTLRWRRAKGASGYSVALELRDGSGLAFETRKPRLRLPARARKGRMRATIVATASAGRVGRPATKRFGSGRRSCRARGTGRRARCPSRRA